MKYQTSQFDYFKLSPLIILLWSVFSVLFMSIIPIASGFGFDGCFYAKVALNFQNMIGHIDAYRANRIFPGVLIHYALSGLNIPINIKSVLLGFQIYNVIIIVAASVFWVLIAGRLSLKPIAKWIGFCALFINYPLLNLHFYYPALTDGTAFFIGMAMLYGYLEKNSILLLAVTMLSFFCWPAGIIVGFLLFVYANAENTGWYYKQERTSPFVILLLLSPFLVFILTNFNVKHLIVQAGLDGIIFRKFDNPDNFTGVNYTYLTNAILNAGYIVAMYWLVLKNFDLVKLISDTLKKRFIPRILVSVVVLALLIVIKRFISSSEVPTLTAPGYFSGYFKGDNVRFPLQFIVPQISYWGPIIIVFILYFKEVVSYLRKSDLPIMFGFLYSVLFSINSESRPIINFYPFLVVILVQAVDFSQFRNKRAFVTLFLVASLVCSKVWFPLNLPTTVFESGWQLTGMDKFPMQGYFMNFGLFINAQMYGVHTVVVLGFLILFYVVIKKPNQLSDASERKISASNTLSGKT